jgi:hypothetical protein
MLRHVTRVLLVATSFSALAYAQCAKDNRSDKHGGVVVKDFTINGTTTLNSTELARLSGSSSVPAITTTRRRCRNGSVLGFRSMDISPLK